MKITVKCEHGNETVLDSIELDWRTGTLLRMLIRDVLLACPACYHEATRLIEDVGP